MSCGRTAVCHNIAEGDLQISTAFAEHVPHGFGAIALQVGEDGVGEVDLGVVAGDHGGVVALLEGGVEGFDELLVFHRVWDSFIYPQISQIEEQILGAR